MEKVKLGVLGVSSHYGLRMSIPVVKSESVKPWALGSRSFARAERAAKKWGFSKAYGSYQEVLDNPEVEAVYIPLPNDMHAEWIRRCADAGKAVLCEKPIALSKKEAIEALEYAEAKGVLAMETFMYRFHPQWIRAKELIDIGEIGEVRTIHTIFGFNLVDQQDIRNQMDRGGGALYDIGCYAISSSRLLLNKEPERVISLISRDETSRVDIVSSAILDFGDVRTLFTVSMRMAVRQKVSVYGSIGSLTMILPFNPFPDVPIELIIRNRIGTRKVFAKPADQYGLMLDAFAKALREGRSAPIPSTDTIANMAVIDAVYRSENSGSWEQVGQ